MNEGSRKAALKSTISILDREYLGGYPSDESIGGAYTPSGSITGVIAEGRYIYFINSRRNGDI